MVCFSTYLLPLATLSCHLVAALPPAVQTLPNMKVGNLASIFDQTDKYPLPNKGNLPAHDPNILEVNNAFYLFKGGVHVPIFKATDLSGPWKQIGTVLEEDSIIPNRKNATRPWAPTTVEWKGKFYCFYSLSQAGARKSAIGVASTDDVEKGSWKDHGALVVTGNENEGSPYNVTNAIDPSFIVDQKTKTPYLNYGSYWHNLWQVPLEDDLLSVKGNTKVAVEDTQKHPQGQGQGNGNGKGEKKNGKNGKNQHEKKNAPVNKPENDKPENDKPENDKPENDKPENDKPENDKPENDKPANEKPGNKNEGKDNQHQNQNQGKKNNDNDKKPNKKQGVQNLEATQLSFLPGQKSKPEEGSWVSFKDGYYYLWFSQGKCCDFEKGFPKKGEEYHIRVGRSKSVNGPFHDKEGNDLLKGGGTTVYASNHGIAYAPGGLGVLPGNENRKDVLYYHYLNTLIGFKHKEAQLGWNYLEYKKGWPVAVAGGSKDKTDNKDNKPESKDKEPKKDDKDTKPKTDNKPEESKDNEPKKNNDDNKQKTDNKGNKDKKPEENKEKREPKMNTHGTHYSEPKPDRTAHDTQHQPEHKHKQKQTIHDTPPHSGPDFMTWV